MRFNFEGQSYLIEFERQPRLIAPRWVDENGVEHDAIVDKQHPTTTATIYTTVENPDNPKKPIKTLYRTYTVATYFRDQNNLENGRKAALRKALYDAPIEMVRPGKGTGEPLMGKRVSYDFKIAVWTAYFGRSDASKAMFEKTLEQAQVEADAN